MNWRAFHRKAAATARTLTGAEADTVEACEGDYRPLYVYLRARFAQRVAMTFADIESLLGFPLPAPARADREWWSGTDPFAHKSPHADAWMLADCVALVNLPACTVMFERRPAPRGR